MRNDLYDLNERVIRNLVAMRLNRRRLVAGAAAVAIAGPAVVASSQRSARAQGDARTLVGLDNIQGGNWLYFDPGKFYEINPTAGIQVIYENLYHVPDGNKIGEIKPLLAMDMPSVASD